MEEKRLNIILYVALALSICSYLYLNIIASNPRTTKSTSINENTAFGITAQMSETDMEKGSSDGEDAILKEDASSVEFIDKGKKKIEGISPEGYHLYVDLDETKMYVFKDGKLIRTYDVSGGKPSTPSPVGTWKIISKDTWGEGFGGAWMGFNVPWGMYGIHGTAEPWFVGRDNASKGCIRMRNEDVLELYKMIPYNTPVTIVHENRPFYPMRDGDLGSHVLEMEMALKKLGYYNGSEDGIFGSALKKAVLEFQKDNNLYKTGVINNSTYELIKERLKELELEQAGSINNGVSG
mgnify:CR=1 FL=1